eukprot:PhM_4_TR4156/c1_g1_i5/m.73996
MGCASSSSVVAASTDSNPHKRRGSTTNSVAASTSTSSARAAIGGSSRFKTYSIDNNDDDDGNRPTASLVPLILDPEEQDILKRVTSSTASGIRSALRRGTSNADLRPGSPNSSSADSSPSSPMRSVSFRVVPHSEGSPVVASSNAAGSPTAAAPLSPVQGPPPFEMSAEMARWLDGYCPALLTIIHSVAPSVPLNRKNLKAHLSVYEEQKRKARKRRSDLIKRLEEARRRARMNKNESENANNNNNSNSDDDDDDDSDVVVSFELVNDFNDDLWVEASSVATELL